MRIYDDRWLMGTEFYKVNRWIFDLRSRNELRGFGWYSWKPYVILYLISDIELTQVEYGSRESERNDKTIVLWTDADTYPIADLTPLYEQCRKDGGIMLFAAEGCVQGAWTKRSCGMKAMACDTEGYRRSQHAVGRFMLFEAGNYRAKQFLMEWQTYLLNPACVGLEPSPDEYPEYVEHRPDQSILGNLAHKYGLKLYREADGFGDGSQRDREIFGTLFNQIGQYDKPKSMEGSRFQKCITHTASTGKITSSVSMFDDGLLPPEECGVGNLLEVGAYEPTEISNSRLLIECGWDATLIEFSPAYAGKRPGESLRR